MFMNVFALPDHRVVYNFDVISRSPVYKLGYFLPADSQYSPVRAVVMNALLM